MLKTTTTLRITSHQWDDESPDVSEMSFPTELDAFAHVAEYARDYFDNDAEKVAAVLETLRADNSVSIEFVVFTINPSK